MFKGRERNKCAKYNSKSAKRKSTAIKQNNKTIKQNNKSTSPTSIIETYSLSKRHIITFCTLYMICLSINIIGMFSSDVKQGVSTYILLSLSNAFSLSSLLILGKAPYLSIVQLFLSQLFVLISDIVNGLTVNESLSNIGVIEVFSSIALLIWFIVFWLKDKKANKNKITISERVKNIVLYKRSILEVPLWGIFVVLCLVLTIFFNEINSATLEVFGSHTDLKILAAIGMILPTVSVIMHYSTTNLTYIFKALLIPFQIYTIYYMHIKHNIEIATILRFTLESAVTIYVIVQYIREKRKAGKMGVYSNEEH